MGPPQTIIKPPSGISLGLRELWQHRELFYFFTWRDVKVKYKQTYLGILWAILQPLGLMVILTFVFSKTLKITSGSTPYPIFALSGLIIWNLFYSSVSHAAESMLHNANIIRKIYFPRLIIPGSAILAALFDFIMALIVFFALVLIYKQPIALSMLLYFPAGILMILIAAFGTGSLLAALNVKFRDFRYALPFLLQIIFFSSQVIYPLQSIQQPWLKYLLSLNPVNGAIELFRSPISGTNPESNTVLLSVFSSILISIIGLLYFKKTEAYFADTI